MTFDPDAEAVEALQCQDLDPLKSAGYVVSEDLQEGEIEFLRLVVESAPGHHPMKEPLSPDTKAVLFAVQGCYGTEIVAQAFRALVFGATTEPLTPDLLVRIADEIDPP